MAKDSGRLDPKRKFSHFSTMLTKQWTKLELLVLLVQRDLASRYQGAVLGNLWPLINQLAQLLIYTYVFSIILKVKLNLNGTQESSPLAFGLWLFAGLIPWIALSSGIAQSCFAVKNQPNLVKKVVFPLSLLPLVPIGVTFLESTLGILLLVVFVAILQGEIHLTILLLPIVIIAQLLLTAGLGYWCAGLTVYLRDIPQLIAVALNLWFYATPIIYPVDLIPEPFSKWVIWFNPMTAIAETYRDLILIGVVSHWRILGTSLMISLSIFISGTWVYQKLRPGFSDVL